MNTSRRASKTERQTVSKITLITPPDFYENSNLSVLLIGFSDEQQDTASKWLGTNEFEKDLNLYYYQGEDTIEWLFYAIARADATYINADNPDPTVQQFVSYFVSRPKVLWSSDNEQRRHLLSFVSNRQVNTIEEFLEGVFSE